jgi:hypothetical protein
MMSVHNIVVEPNLNEYLELHHDKHFGLASDSYSECHHFLYSPWPPSLGIIPLIR